MAWSMAGSARRAGRMVEWRVPRSPGTGASFRESAKPIKHMRPQRVTCGQRGIIEVIGRITVHAEPFHDASRAVVHRRRKGHDFGQCERAEPVGKRQLRGFRCIAPPPMLDGQTPTDFDTRSEMGAEAWDRQSGKTHKGSHARDLDRPQTKAAFAKMPLNPINHSVALGTTETTSEEFHDARIAIHCRKGIAILVA